MSREDTPWTVGTADGFNASNIYDAQGNGIAQVFGVPMHTRLDDVDPARWEGLEKARLIVRAVNSHAALISALADLADAARSACDARQHSALVAALAEADFAIAKAEAA